MDRFNQNEDMEQIEYINYCEQVYNNFPNWEMLETDEFSIFFDDVIHLYYDNGVDESVAAQAIAGTYNVIDRQKYIVLQDHLKRIAKKYKTATDWFEKIFPHGLGYLHPTNRHFIGINVITKQFITEFLEVYEKEKKQPEWLNQTLNECDGTYEP